MSIKKLLNIFKRKDNKDVISFGPGFALTELPIISLYQGENHFNFLLDTGSNDSIIDSNILDKLEYDMSDKQNSLFGMEGNKEVVSICNITLSYNGVDFPYEYNIRDMSAAFGSIKTESGVTLHGIIGSKFFNKYKYVLDFESLIAYAKR
jgi:hypothetical protein